MTMDLPDWDEMAAEPEKLVAALEEGLGELQKEARLMRVRLRTAQRLVEVKADALYLREHGAPRPKGVGADAGEDDTGAAADAGEVNGATRKVQVVSRLTRDPERRFKVAEIAELLDVDNLKSLRTSLDEFARSGVIRKNTEDKTYQAVPGS